MGEAPLAEQLSEVCATCGFCCSGLLNDYATLKDDELEFARAIALSVGTHPITGETIFHLPCPHACGSACSIYQEPRPSICSKYFCELAKKFNRGDVGRAEVAAKVREAQHLMGRIEPMLLAGESWTAARERWCSNRGAAPQRPADAEFQLLMTTLNLFLDRHFRPADGRILI